MSKSTNQLHGYRERLERELASALAADPIHVELVERLVQQLLEEEARAGSAASREA